MVKLQNNFTTPEQSKRLLELGVPADSADCICWSVGRLMEICKICEPKKYYEELCEELQWSQNYCVVIISHIIANLPIIDFSKLEE